MRTNRGETATSHILIGGDLCSNMKRYQETFAERHTDVNSLSYILRSGPCFFTSVLSLFNFHSALVLYFSPWLSSPMQSTLLRRSPVRSAPPLSAPVPPAHPTLLPHLRHTTGPRQPGRGCPRVISAELDAVSDFDSLHEPIAERSYSDHGA